MKWQRNYDTKNRTWAGESSFWAASCSRTRPANSRQSHKWDVSGSWWTYFRGGIKLHEHSPCLCKDGNVFQITDGRMEILVARLDFSLLGCRGSSRPTRHFSKKGDSLHDQSAKNLLGMWVWWSITLMRSFFMKFWLLQHKRRIFYELNWLTICLWSCIFKRVIVNDIALPRCCSAAAAASGKELLGKWAGSELGNAFSILAFIYKYFSSGLRPPLRGKNFNKRVGIKYS